MHHHVTPSIENGTIKGSRTSCCSRGSRKHAGDGTGRCRERSAGSCAITIKKPRELSGQAITKSPFGGYRVRLTVRKFARRTMGQAAIDGESRGGSRAKASRSSDLHIEVAQSGASVWYFDSTGWLRWRRRRAGCGGVGHTCGEPLASANEAGAAGGDAIRCERLQPMSIRRTQQHAYCLCYA